MELNDEGKYNDEAFEEGVNKAYDILWAMFKPEGGCDYNIGQEEKLGRIINFIDNEMGR